MQTNEAIALWKELGITTADMEFSCGGDSMNDYHFTFYNSENKEVQSGELESFFDDDVFIFAIAGWGNSLNLIY